MKLYYNIETDTLEEVGVIEGRLFARDAFGRVRFIRLDHNLKLIGEVYENPIKIESEFELKRVDCGVFYSIITGETFPVEIKEGFRFLVAGRGFSSYSTNIVTAAYITSSNTIDFFTLSGSHYVIELK